MLPDAACSCAAWRTSWYTAALMQPSSPPLCIYLTCANLSLLHDAHAPTRSRTGTMPSRAAASTAACAHSACPFPTDGERSKVARKSMPWASTATLVRLPLSHARCDYSSCTDAAAKATKNSNPENSASTMRSSYRGLACELIPFRSGCWNTARTNAPSGHVNWRSCSVHLGSNS